MINTTGFMTRGALYMVWGDDANPANDEKISKVLDRSISSLVAVHPELPYEVIRLPKGSLLDKATMFDRSPYDETLFLDADTVVMDKIDFGFEKAAKFGLACCVNECPWGRRYAGLGDHGAIVEYNTGVMFFNRTAKPVFDKWKSLIAEVDSTLHFNAKGQTWTMPHNDQAAFAQAIDDLPFNPFVLPLNWNLRPMWQTSLFGPIVVWHDYTNVPPGVQQWNDKQLTPGQIIDYARLGAK